MSVHGAQTNTGVTLELKPSAPLVIPRLGLTRHAARLETAPVSVAWRFLTQTLLREPSTVSRAPQGTFALGSSRASALQTLGVLRGYRPHAWINFSAPLVPTWRRIARACEVLWLGVYHVRLGLYIIQGPGIAMKSRALQQGHQQTSLAQRGVPQPYNIVMNEGPILYTT